MRADVAPLSQADQDQLDHCRAWVEGQALPAFLQADPDSAVDPSDTVAGRLALLRALFEQPEARWPADRLAAMGVVLGDALAEYLQMDWCRIHDEHGPARAIQKAGEPIRLFPESMLAKRVQAGERIDVFALFSGIVAQVQAYRQQMSQ